MINGDRFPVSDSMDKNVRAGEPQLFQSIRRQFVADIRGLEHTAQLHSCRIANHEVENGLMTNSHGQASLPEQGKSPLELRSKTATEAAKLVVHKDKQERHLEIPDGWNEFEKHTRPGCLYAEYQAPDSARTRFAYWNRGYGGNKLGAANAAAFKSILAQDAHVLSADETRLANAVLSNGILKNEECFKIMPGGLRTEVLSDGSKILVLEANWTETGMKSYGIFADFDGSGQYVEQAYMIAPAKEYDKQLGRSKAALYSLRWK